MIVVYSALGTGVTLVGMAVPRVNAAVPTLIVVLGAMLGAAYIHVVERHGDIWSTAYRAELQGMDRIEGAYPSPPSGALIIASGYPAYQTLGVPIFSARWDLNGMVKLRYGKGSLSAVPRTEQLDFACLGRGIEVEEEGAATGISARYGKAMLVDLQTGRPRCHATSWSAAGWRRSSRPAPCIWKALTEAVLPGSSREGHRAEAARPWNRQLPRPQLAGDRGDPADVAEELTLPVTQSGGVLVGSNQQLVTRDRVVRGI